METAKYKVTGLVDIFDEQGQITGQYPVGSIQELTVERGTAAVVAGQAEAVGADEVVDDADDSTGATGEDELDSEDEEDAEDDENATGATGEEEVE